MLVIVGLGNPGEKYKDNRHNVGHIFADYLIKELRMTDNELKIYKTNCFMNESGKFVKKLIRNSQFAINNLIIVHDDLDIPLGKFKIQKGTGPMLHNGIKSIEEALKTKPPFAEASEGKDFLRIRIGIDARSPQTWVDGETYVLHNFKEDELKIVKSIFPEILNRLQPFMVK